MLTDSECHWLIDREWTLEVMGSYTCGPCQYRDKDDLLCIFRKCPKFEPDYKDAAEFEARVAVKMTRCWEEIMQTPSAGGCGGCTQCHPDDEDVVMKPTHPRHKDCNWCQLLSVRLEVEEEMEDKRVGL